MRYSEIVKRQSFIIVISIIGISLILLGASYALFMSNHQGSDQTLSAGTLSATFSGSTILSTDLVPLTDEEALASETNVYTFKLNNTGSLAMEYKLTLANSLDGVNDNNMIAHKYVKVKFDDNEPIYLDKLTKLDDSKTNENEVAYALKTDIINSGVSNEAHTIRIWISDVDSSGAETEESIIGKAIAFKIGLEGKATDSYFLTLANHVKSLYSSQGSGSLYLHEVDLANSANDGSYRYAGANPDNYVCFGSDAETCPADNIYRIIGVFGGQVKLIKSGSIGDMAWSSNGNNMWSSSSLNTFLNGTYLTSLGTWENKIAFTSWQVGGMVDDKSKTAKQYYDVEIPSIQGTTYNAKIGLMYVSDYGFGAEPDYWNIQLYNYSPAKDSNWLNVDIIEWTISHDSNNSWSAFQVHSRGSVDGSEDVYTISAIRPTFYLDSKVIYKGGSGSVDDPMRIE